MDKNEKETKKVDHDDEGIKVKCPNCGYEEELKDLSAWSFIIMKKMKCPKCKTLITHDNTTNIR